MNDTSTLLGLCAAGDVPDGGVLKVEAGGLTVAVFHLGERYYVTDDACTHGPGSLSEGCVDGDVIECDFHHGAFNIITGEVVSAPCMEPLRTYPTTVADGHVYIRADAV